MSSPPCILLAVALAACAAPHRHPDPPPVVVDRPCEAARYPSRCALAGNAVEGRAEVIDAYTLRISLTLRETISGCGDVWFTVSAGGREAQASARCPQECPPEGRGGGRCRYEPVGALGFEVVWPELLSPGDHALQLTSSDGALQPVELVAHVSEQPQKAPATLPPEPPPAPPPRRPMPEVAAAPTVWVAGAGREVCSRDAYDASQREVANLRRQLVASDDERTRQALAEAKGRSLHLIGDDRPLENDAHEVFARLKIPVDRMGRPDWAAVEAHVAKKVADGTLSTPEAECLRWLLSRRGDGVMNPASRGAGIISERIAAALKWFGIDR